MKCPSGDVEQTCMSVVWCTEEHVCHLHLDIRKAYVWMRLPSKNE